jgi:hypothetical protein
VSWLSGSTLALQHASTDASGRFGLRVWAGISVVEAHVSVGDKPVEGIKLVIPR